MDSFPKPIMFIILLASLAANVLLWLQIGEYRVRPPSYYPTDKAYIERASKAWSKKSLQTLEEIEKDRCATTIYFPDKICVSLDLELGGLGESPVYCSRKTDGKLLEEYSDVE